MELKYPYYDQNPNLRKLMVVETIHGTKEYKVNCVKYPDGFYVKNKDLIHFEGKWNKKENLTFDHELQRLQRGKKGLIEGIVGHNKGVIELGWFTPNPYNNCKVYLNNGTYECMDYKMLDEEYFIEDISTNQIYKLSEISSAQIQKYNRKRLAVNNDKNVYNVVDNPGLFEATKEMYNGSNIKLDLDVRYASKFLGNLTFGFEVETINGMLPQHICNQYGIIICKDGSIKDGDGRYPPEYVTVPYQGAKGVQSIRNVLAEIAKRSDINSRCSLHLHLGGFDMDRMFFVSLYKLCEKLQDDIFKMFPYYKNDEVRYAGKDKNYCKKIPEILKSYGSGNFNTYINKSYEDIYSFLTGGERFGSNSNFDSGYNPWGGHKWDIKTRYYWVNFTNIIFGKQDTIEFRIHTPTLNADKAINWLFMCAAIIQYAIGNVKKCISNEPISFRDDVLNYYGEKRCTKYSSYLSENLKAYYDERVKYFLKDYNNGDFMSEGDIATDKDYKFNAIKIN